MGTKSGYWIKNFIVRTKNTSGGSSKILTLIFCWSATLVLGIFSFFHFFPLSSRLSLPLVKASSCRFSTKLSAVRYTRFCEAAIVFEMF